MHKLGLFLILFFLVSSPVLAADFICDGPEKITNNSSFKIDIYVEPADSNINAVGGTISYLGNKLILEDVQDGGSIVSLWLDEPTLEKTLNNRLEFNGLIPGGYNGPKAYLFSLIFRVNRVATDNSAEVKLNDLQFLLNNGQGTKIAVSPVNYRVVIASQGTVKDDQDQTLSAENYQTPVDKFPPEKFTPLAYFNPPTDSNKRFLAFSSNDKQSGISHYEIAKSNKLSTNYQRLAWTKVISPYKLSGDDLGQYLYIKAVDRQGNFQVAVINPLAEDSLRRSVQAVIEIIGILSGLILVYIVWQHLHKK